ncbi:MAG: sigma-70 family RNA polymerase sigma factor [Chloroflexota bacterium]
MLEWAARLRRREVIEPPGPRQAVADAYCAYLEPLYRYIYRHVGNRETAEDLTGEVFARAVQGLDSARAPHAIRAWLYAVARTSIVDHWRGQGGGTVDISLLEETLAATAGPNGETNLVGAGAERRVAAVLSRLDERDQTVLRLRFLEGYSVTEAAQALGVSEGNLKVLQHRALKKAAAQSGEKEP